MFLWATRLVGGLLRRAARETAQWTLHRGTACWALHDWLVLRGWLLVGEWQWRHALANEALNLVVPLLLLTCLPCLNKATFKCRLFGMNSNVLCRVLLRLLSLK